MMRALRCLTGVMMLLPATAFAHAFLERAEPAVGSEVSAPPQQLVLTFTEGVEPLFTTVQLRDPSGVNVSTGKPHTERGNDRKLVVPLPSLGRGKYTVIWHATSVDTHKTEGSFQFTIMQ
jgi:methionine-rich copper-binding protein CopC